MLSEVPLSDQVSSPSSLPRVGAEAAHTHKTATAIRALALALGGKDAGLLFHCRDVNSPVPDPRCDYWGILLKPLWKQMRSGQGRWTPIIPEHSGSRTDSMGTFLTWFDG